MRESRNVGTETGDAQVTGGPHAVAVLGMSGWYGGVGAETGDREKLERAGRNR